MTTNEAISKIATELRSEHCFIKLYKTGHRLVDFDLIEKFICNHDKNENIDEFELLDIEQMWQTLIDLDPDKLTRSGKGKDEVIEWYWLNGEGIEKKITFPFSPDGIMNIINDELFA